jgi:DNA modification methylase
MNYEKFTFGKATLYCGDCREIIGNLQFDAIVSDPPYGLSKICKWSRASKEIYKGIDWDDEAPDVTFLLERNVPTMLFGGNYFANLPPSRKWIIWDKGGQFHRRTFAEAELCYCNFDGNIRLFKSHSNCYGGFVKGREKLHPTQKPVDVMQYCISELPKGIGNVICDPYMGSGTTGVAAILEGRSFIGIERDKRYFDKAVERIMGTRWQSKLFE